MKGRIYNAEKTNPDTDTLQKVEPSASVSISDEGFMKYHDTMQVNSWEMVVAESGRKIPAMDGFDEHYRMICAYASAYQDIKQG